MKITTREELIAHIALHKEVCVDIPLFEGNDYNGNTWVRDVSIPARAEVTIGYPIHGAGENKFEFLFENGNVKGSLIDRNIPENSYNNHWWFTTHEEAEEHIRPKQFVVGKYYEWDINKCYNKQKPCNQGGALECVYVSPSQGVFRQRDGYLAIIALGHLKSGEFKLRQ
jgi:hypothetical protein